MEWSDVLDDAAAKLDALAIPYVVVGSCASMIYGEVRFTRDVDIPADVAVQHIPSLMAAFPPPDHYLSEVAIADALRRKSQFNIIYNQWGVKVDVMIPDAAAREMNQLGLGITITRTSGQPIRFASPEHVIIKKLEYYQIGGSEKHLRDIAGMLKLSAFPIDRDLIATWSAKIGAQDTWETLVAKVDSFHRED
jgi:hypothetical protein